MSNRTSKMRLVYVAGRYRGKRPIDVKRNIRLADMAGEWIVEHLGQMPVIPHKNTEGYEGLGDDEFFLEGTLEIMRRCDAVYLLPGWEQSAGARGEKAEANRLEIPTFTTFAELAIWINDQEIKEVKEKVDEKYKTNDLEPPIDGSVCSNTDI